MILYIESPKGSIKNLLELINEYGRVTRHKINIQKIILFLDIRSGQSKTEIKKTIPFIKASKN